MAILYRAMWSDTGSGDLSDVVDRFHSWVRSRAPAFDGADILAGAGSIQSGGAEVRIERAGPDDVEGIDDALQGRLIESRDDGTRWTTTLRAWTGAACLGDGDPRLQRRLWVDVQAVSRESLDVVVRAPRLVRDLLADGTHPQRRRMPLSATVLPFTGEGGAEALAHHITSIDRDLPIVVCTSAVPPPELAGAADTTIEDAMSRAATVVAGMGLVCWVDESAAEALEINLGRQYAVWGGAFRIYSPGTDPALDESWRHRYVPPQHFLREPDAASRMIVRAVSPIGISRRADDSYEHAKAALRRQEIARHDGELSTLLSMVEEDNIRLVADVQSANQRISDLEAGKAAMVGEHEQLLEENAELRDRLEAVTAQLRASVPSQRAVPQHCHTPTEAYYLAGQYLADHLRIPEAACRDLPDIDSTNEANAWGQSSWRAFRALHAYAVALADPDSTPGTFWTWCEKSGDPRGWPATSKKLAMSESSTVENTPKLREQRRLPVDPSVDPSGRVLMFAHIKIAEGGGNLAPRIYFHVDEKQALVHVGYFGPHKHLSNKST